jgi:hypothetical protein
MPTRNWKIYMKYVSERVKFQMVISSVCNYVINHYRSFQEKTWDQERLIDAIISF